MYYAVHSRFKLQMIALESNTLGWIFLFFCVEFAQAFVHVVIFHEQVTE